MAASRFLLTGASALFLRSHKPLISKPKPPFISSKTISLKPLLFRLYSSSAALDTATTENNETLSSTTHPWPEWMTFIDHLKTKGYFTGESHKKNSSDVGFVDGSDADKSDYHDVDLLKDPCLSFARDRYDVFKSLSMQDIQTVVEIGCPNLLRKAVNSSKRLRAHVRLDEGDVCGGCNLRGSCDKAYVIIKETEATARTVDLVRILLFYALDPLVFSQEKPPGRELVEVSARKLLSELIELSDSPCPPPPKSVAAKAPKQKRPSLDIIDDELPPDIEMKRGDWTCPKCNFMNFSRNVKCLKCKEEGPKKVGSEDIEMKKGDWICPECTFMNFSRNKKCKQCQAEGPTRKSVDEVEMRKGDWNCSKCSFMNFASNKQCLRCEESRPKRELNPGEWECPKCDFLNYRRNKVCLKCDCQRPKETMTYDEDHVWRKPKYKMNNQ